jgi:NhaP-type Na+/H+ and K+/H+ antiporter
MNTFQLVASVIPLLGIVFTAGTQVNRIDDLYARSHVQEADQKHTGEVVLEIHKKVTRIETILDERLKPVNVKV